MRNAELLRLHNMLKERRREMLDRVRRLETGWQDLDERDIEPEEEAQKASITEPYEDLLDRVREQVDLIDLALRKITVSEYGVCESCGAEVETRRLEALPWARLCVDCARELENRHERLPAAEEVARFPGARAEYEGLSDRQALDMVHDYLEEEGHVALDRVKISVNHGAVVLEGHVKDEFERKTILEAIEKVMGFSSVADELRVGAPSWRRKARQSIRRSVKGHPALKTAG